MNKNIKNSIGLILIAFALLTLFLSTSVIFDLFGVREKEGNYVLFVVVANFISSLLYFVAVYGYFENKKWSYKPLVLSGVVLVLVQIAFLIYVNEGGVHETKTIWAMFFRITITLLFSYIFFKQSKKIIN